MRAAGRSVSCGPSARTRPGSGRAHAPSGALAPPAGARPRTRARTPACLRAGSGASGCERPRLLSRDRGGAPDEPLGVARNPTGLDGALEDAAEQRQRLPRRLDRRLGEPVSPPAADPFRRQLPQRDRAERRADAGRTASCTARGFGASRARYAGAHASSTYASSASVPASSMGERPEPPGGGSLRRRTRPRPAGSGTFSSASERLPATEPSRQHGRSARRASGPSHRPE